MRKMRPDNYELSDTRAVLKGCELTLEDVDSPTFIALRQLDFNMELGVDVSFRQEDTPSKSIIYSTAGVTVYGCENEHYDLLIRKADNSRSEAYEAVLRLNIGDIKHEQTIIPIDSPSCRLIIRSDALTYHFYIQTNASEIFLGSAQSKYLSSEVSSGFTGVVLGLFAEGNSVGTFTNLQIEYM